MLHSRAVLLLFLFFELTYGLAQNRELDSLYRVIKTSDTIANIAAAHARVAWLTAYSDLISAKKHLDSSFVIYNHLKDEDAIAKVHYKYAAFNRVSGDYKEALNHLELYIKYAETQKFPGGLADAAYQKGVIHSLQGDYQQSLKEYYNALTFYESDKQNINIANTLNSIGIVYRNLKKYSEAEISYKKAIAIQESNKDWNNLSNSYGNLGNLFDEQGMHTEALGFFNKSLEIDVKTNNNWGVAMNYQSLGATLNKKGDYNKAISYLNMAYEIQLKNEYKNELGGTLSNLGYSYLHTEDLEKSENLLIDALRYSKNSKTLNREIHANLLELYKKTNNFKKALFHYDQTIAYKDSIFNEANLKDINALQIQYETQKKDNKIALQKLQIQEQENAILKKKNQYNIALGTGIFFLLGSIGIWLFYMQRQKLKNNEIRALQTQQEVLKLEALIDGEEKERNRLAQDLHDGINGDLAVIKYKISSIEPNKFSKKEKIFYDDALGMLDNAVEQVRRISHNLAPPSLHNFDLVEAIQQFCSKQNASNSVHISFQYFGNRLVLKKENEIAIYRITQELLNNIIKHANASEALVQLNNHEDKLMITVEDNGQGFDPNSSGKGIGLQNIKSRVNFLKATLDINSSKKGTTFSIEIDLDKLDKK
ncbi:tetratricopeptide repeat protein [Maribacter sp. IgM3_T14_3]|uniref:ATP-binding protein n=1 Tax=Maribacter sp. IgM3_T14_3 TaxID=3415140 RepID=UPI003C6FCE71